MSRAQSDHQTDFVNFADFSAANTAAVHLLENIRSEISPPTLERTGNTIGYQLSAPLLSNNCDFGDFWRIGAGPPMAIIERKLDHCKPNILLCPPEGTLGAMTARQFIKDIHATMHFHLESRVLILTTTSSRPIIYEQGDIGGKNLELGSPNRRSCVMRRTQNFLRFGDYRFVLEFIAKGQDKDEFRIQPGDLDHGYHGLYPSPLFDSTLMAYYKTSWNVWLHKKKPNTSITSGVNIYTGEPVAVKKLQNTAALLPFIIQRLRIACQYDKRLDKGVLGVMDVWCDHKTSPPCLFNRPREVLDYCQHTLYSMPLARHNFHNMPWVKIEAKKCPDLFYQTLLGLAELHQKNIIHGNILPESLLILTETAPATSSKNQFPPRRAVISLNMRRIKKYDASVCVAPEVWQREDHKSLDGTKLDIWALAASWLFAFAAPPKNMKIKEASYYSIQKVLDSLTEKGSIEEPLARLLRQMLAWEP
ncbi:hypothetical protein V8C37DRAFT_367426 [Trichoderma ceciliae]